MKWPIKNGLISVNFMITSLVYKGSSLSLGSCSFLVCTRILVVGLCLFSFSYGFLALIRICSLSLRFLLWLSLFPFWSFDGCYLVGVVFCWLCDPDLNVVFIFQLSLLFCPLTCFSSTYLTASVGMVVIELVTVRVVVVGLLTGCFRDGFLWRYCAGCFSMFFFFWVFVDALGDDYSCLGCDIVAVFFQDIV